MLFYYIIYTLIILIFFQQDQIDSVEYYALQATEHVESGGQELLKGTVSRRKAKKVQLSFCIFVIIKYSIKAKNITTLSVYSIRCLTR